MFNEKTNEFTGGNRTHDYTVYKNNEFKCLHNKININ